MPIILYTSYYIIIVLFLWLPTYFTLNFRCRAGGSSVGNIPHIAGRARTAGGVGGWLTGDSDATGKRQQGADGWDGVGGRLTGDSDDRWMATPAGRADGGGVGNI